MLARWMLSLWPQSHTGLLLRGDRRDLGLIVDVAGRRLLERHLQVVTQGLPVLCVHRQHPDAGMRVVRSVRGEEAYVDAPAGGGRMHTNVSHVLLLKGPAALRSCRSRLIRSL